MTDSHWASSEDDVPLVFNDTFAMVRLMSFHEMFAGVCVTTRGVIAVTTLERAYREGSIHSIDVTALESCQTTVNVPAAAQ